MMVAGFAGILFAGSQTSCASDSKAGAESKTAGTKSALETQATPAAKPNAKDTEWAMAIFAGGCFWCVETAFEGKPGVHDVVSGYAGGKVDAPTYDEVSAGGTGHAEAVQVAYDPKIMTYAQLLEIFWHNIDPTQANGQFCDRGSQYRSVIFYANEDERKLAETTKAEVAKKLGKKIVTEIAAAPRFYPAEDYHQDFWKKDPQRYYSYRAGCGRDARLKQLWGKVPDQAH
jgi:peptide-methionine (S)-S-oxide reductase